MKYQAAMVAKKDTPRLGPNKMFRTGSGLGLLNNNYYYCEKVCLWGVVCSGARVARWLKVGMK